MTEKNFRIEHDLLGEREIPAACYYGVQTLRAVENFRISGIKLGQYRSMVQSLAYIKKAAARANAKLGLLPEEIAQAISQACEDVIAGKYDDQFVVDMIQGGAGTSSNMNANEVIANLSLEKLGYEKGRYDIIHPNNHVNMCQSTNDVYPTAIRLALIFKIRGLLDAMRYLYEAIEYKSIEFRDVIKMGRTQLQDAVPMSLRQEFAAFAVMVGEDIERVKETKKLLREINLGATAIGTGLNAHPEYSPLAILSLRKFTGIEVEASVNLVEATQDTGVYVQLSGVLKRVAVKLSKRCNDLRLLSSGPRCGFNEIHLPAMAPGSTIMPGKVNPVIPEVVNQVAYHVIGNDITVTFAAEAGQLQLNAMEPVIAFSLFNSITFLSNACLTLADRCIKGITANRDQCRLNTERSIGMVTALNPHIGYEKASEVAHEALETGKSVCELVLEKGYLSKGELDSILSPEHMIKPHYFQGGQRKAMKKRVFARLALAVLISVIMPTVGCTGRDGADKSLEIVRLRGYFVVGLDDAFPPMGFRKQADDKTVRLELNLDRKAVEEVVATDELVGFDIDLAKKAAEKLGLKVIFKPVAWDGIIASLNAGEVDMIWNGLSVTPERKGQIIFFRPYLDNRQIIMIKSGSGIGGKAALKGKRVGLQLGSTSDTALHADRSIALQIGELKRYPENRSAMGDLEMGRLDAVIVDEVAGRYYSAKKPGVFAILADNLGNELYAVGFRKNAVSLRNAIDTALAEMKRDGSADMIAAKWFGAAIIKK